MSERWKVGEHRYVVETEAGRYVADFALVEEAADAVKSHNDILRQAETVARLESIYAMYDDPADAAWGYLRSVLPPDWDST